MSKKIPILIICEVNKDEYPDYIDNLPAVVSSRLKSSGLWSKIADNVICLRFAEGVTRDMVLQKLENRKSLPIVDWYSEENNNN